MANEYVVYTGHDNRVAHISKNNIDYVPVVYEKIPYYFMDTIPEEENYYNYSIKEIRNSLVYEKRLNVTETIQESLVKQKKIISILEKLNAFSRFYLRAYDTSYVSRYMSSFLKEEIDTYKKTGEIGTVLRSLVENQSLYNVDDIVARELMKMEDIKNMLSYLYQIETRVKNLIEEEKYKDAVFLLKKEKGKMKW